MSSFQVEYTKKAEKDLQKLRDQREAIKIIDKISSELSNPFPKPPLKKRIKGISGVLMRLRIDTTKESYRIFYTFRNGIVTILRVVRKKDADKFIKSFR